MKTWCSRRELLQHTGATALGLMGSLRPLAADRGERLKTEPSIERVVEELRTSIPGRMERAKVPGLSIALIRDARVVWSQGFGVKSTASREPVTADTVFEAASLSKPAFAYAFLKLCETREIGLDRSLAEFLPEPFVPDEPRLKQITTRRVLSHTSGLPHGRPAGSPIRLRFTPGERFAYSASGFYYLQTVAEQLTKQPLAPFMTARLLAPLGMKDSSFGGHDRYEKAAAQGHWQDGKPGLSGNGQYLKATAEERAQRKQEYPESQYPSAAAGLYTTAPDFARFMIEILNPSLPDEARLASRSLAEMLRPQVHVADGVDWGLGWGLQKTKAGRAFWHWGDWGCFRNFCMAYPEEKLGVVVLTNSFNGPKAYREIVPRALGGEYPAISWLQSYRP